MIGQLGVDEESHAIGYGRVPVQHGGQQIKLDLLAYAGLMEPSSYDKPVTIHYTAPAVQNPVFFYGSSGNELRLVELLNLF